MSVVEPGSTQSNLIQRVKDILLRPSPTWDAIEAEPASVGSLYKGYILPLAAVPVVCGLIGMVVFGVGIPGIAVFKPSIGSALASAVVQYVLSLVSVFLLALLIDGLAPTFGGQKNQIQALKVAAYSSTAAWLSGVFSIYPPLAILGLLGLYSLFLLYKGLPRLMKSPEDKSVPYIAVIIIAGIVLAIIVATITGPIMRLGAPGPFAGRDVGGEVRIGDTTVDLGKLEAAARQVEAAAEGRATGGATDPAAFKAYLPERVAGYSRTELSTGSGGVAGIEGSSATATYAKGESRMTLAVTDLGAMGALAALGGAFNMESTSEENGRYEKVGKVGGRMTMEEYDSNSRHGSYSVMIGERFMVQAEGEGVTMDELKSAVSAIDAGRLEKLASAG